ncbi:hypothetical protein A5642_22505 [Mycolicibacterium mucogenicum]|uniref:Uncharacterized protein n=1 Tax=Mycolicibacterium mucogenicum TaxID=56689 RepID=A0A1A0MP15_MYCMU|nr:hypothetical protein [Mycolicibacterium mucogenicum]OBA86513.1 hypothetical protein A5642_22505 [Mycolicibacterium mucogenicum]
MTKMSGWSSRDLAVGYIFGAISVVVVLVAVWGISRLPSDQKHAPTLIGNFAATPNGATLKAEDGREWFRSSNGAAGADLEVIAGKLTNKAVVDGTAAGYLSADLPGAVTTITAKFGFFGGDSTDGGSDARTGNGAAIILVHTDPPPKSGNPMAHLTSPCHVAITPTNIDFGVINDSRLDTLDSVKFDKPLDSGKEYEVNIEINYETGIAKISGPDGRSRVHSDPRISSNRGSIVSFEVYQKNAATDDRSYFTYVEAG